MTVPDLKLPHDTQKDSAIKQVHALRKMGIAGRAEMTFQLSDNLRSIVESGIRHRHPEYTQKQVIKAILSLTVDKDLLDQAFPKDEATT